jgi:hypothetical protein
VLRTIAWALIIAFAIGWLIGSLLRRELERPERYLGSSTPSSAPMGAGASVAARHPGHIGHASPRIFVSRQHEEQIR